MSEYRVNIPVTVTIPVRSLATTKGDAYALALKAVHGFLPWLDTQIHKDGISVEELADGSPLAKELFIKASVPELP